MAKKSEIIKSQNKELDEYLKKFKSENQNLIFDGIGMGIMPGFVSKTSKGAKIAMNSKKGKAMYNELASKLKSFTGKTKTNISKTKPTVKEVIETKPNIPTNIPTTMELAQIPGTSVKTIKEGIKSFTGKTEKFVPKTNRLITRANSSAGNLKPFKGSATRPGSTPMNYTPTDPSKALSSIKEVSKIVSKMPKEKLDNFSKILLGTAGLGIASGISYQGYKSYQGLTSKPIDLNNIKEADLIDSTKYKDVKIIKTSTGDKGIIKDPKTGKWKYFNEKEGVLLKNKVGLGDGPPIGLDNNNQNKGNNQGSNKSGNTTPRSATGQSFDKAFAEARKQAGGAGGIFEWNGKKYGTALKGETIPKDRVEVGKTTTPLMGDEEYKKDPRLATLRQQDDDRQLLARAEAQKKEMMEFEPTEVLPTKPLSSLVFKTTNRRDEQAALYNIEADNKLPLKKKKYGGNLAMLKYMK